MDFEPLLKKYKRDVSQELIEFTGSPNFKHFELIMENLYLAKLEELHGCKETEDIVIAQKTLNIYSNLSNLFRFMTSEAISSRRDKHEKEVLQ